MVSDLYASASSRFTRHLKNHEYGLTTCWIPDALRGPFLQGFLPSHLSPPVLPLDKPATPWELGGKAIAGDVGKEKTSGIGLAVCRMPRFTHQTPLPDVPALWTKKEQNL